MKLTIDIDEDVARDFARWHGTAHAEIAAGWVAEAIAAALPPQARPIQPGDRIRYNNDEGVWFGRHRGLDVVWLDREDRPMTLVAVTTHADGTPVLWSKVRT